EGRLCRQNSRRPPTGHASRGKISPPGRPTICARLTGGSARKTRLRGRGGMIEARDVIERRIMPKLTVALMLAIGTALVAVAAWAQAEAGAVRRATEPVMRQLEAFRRDDFDVAYTFASEEIRQRFDREAFERMVRGGYPEIARSTSATVTGSRR